MDSGSEIPRLIACCYKSTCTLGYFIDRVEAFMAEFRPIHPLFSQLCLVGRSDADSPPLLPDMSNLRPWIMRRGWERKTPKGSEYTLLDERGWPTEASEGNMGFRVALYNKQGFDRKADLFITQGSPTHGNEIDVRLPPLHPEFHRGDLPRQIMDVVLRHWSVGHASYSTSAFREAVVFSETQEKYSAIVTLGWLTYVNDPSIAEALPLGMPCSRLGSGVLFELGHSITELADSKRIAQGLALRETLRAAGKLKFALRP